MLGALSQQDLKLVACQCPGGVWTRAACSALCPNIRQVGGVVRPISVEMPCSTDDANATATATAAATATATSHTARYMEGIEVEIAYGDSPLESLLRCFAVVMTPAESVPRQLHEEEPLDLRTPRLVRPWRQRSGGRGV